MAYFVIGHVSPLIYMPKTLHPVMGISSSPMNYFNCVIASNAFRPIHELPCCCKKGLEEKVKDRSHNIDHRFPKCPFVPFCGGQMKEYICCGYVVIFQFYIYLMWLIDLSHVIKSIS